MDTAAGLAQFAIEKLRKDATEHGFCPACAMNMFARLVIAAASATEHESDSATDETPSGPFNATPGRA